ncbi:MAG TPA: SDR family NAD(P)-dependent oxidoreductase [Gammaproteobacteria bacterium]|jgi:NAD(P)-dependent dehydrogenase (short-subunit alcohol dehydrogenase family)|nr:SDR family NAD(P)-dependent oxidoreductase [Gammaproteobacteria bacterium]
MEIKDSAVVITGAASGMGAATAHLFSQLGAKVALLDINQKAAEDLAQKIRGLAIACDVTHADSVTTALTTAAQQHGPARICINCAGIIHGRRLVNQQGAMPLEEFQHVININLIGTFNVMRLAAAAMLPLSPLGESAERGIIINTASIAAYEGQIGQTAYSASKGGIVSLTLPAARELAAFNIRVMAIAPGLVDTPLFEKISPEARAALAAAVPFPKRLGFPKEYALLAQHIVENPLLNGEVIRLDGALRMPPK